VHFAALRHPLAGDTMYGADPTLAARLGLQRQWLHAMRLAFDHPGSGERIELSSSYPEDLQSALERLGDPR
jgi:23S rRNA pseudouridine1911/1915/1917 synthase